MPRVELIDFYLLIRKNYFPKKWASEATLIELISMKNEWNHSRLFKPTPMVSKMLGKSTEVWSDSCCSWYWKPIDCFFVTRSVTTFLTSVFLEFAIPPSWWAWRADDSFRSRVMAATYRISRSPTERMATHPKSSHQWQCFLFGFRIR